MAILKAVGRGFLYILGLPLFLLVLSITAVCGLFMLVFMFFKSIVLFFTGRSLNDDLPEDKKAKEIKEGKKPTATPAPQPVEEEPVVSAPIQEQQQPIVQTIIVNQQPNPEPNEVEVETIDPISQPVETESEPVFEEEPETDLPSDFAPVIEDEPEPLPSNDEVSVEEEPVKEINIGQYTPHTDKERFFDEVDEEDEEDTGVDIIYGDDDD